MNKNTIQSRINSAIVINNQKKFSIKTPSQFNADSKAKFQQQFNQSINQITHESCPLFSEYQMRPKTPAKIQFKQRNHHNKNCQSSDLRQYTQKKQEQLQVGQINLRRYLQQEKQLERRYLKQYKREDKEFFKHKQQPKKKEEENKIDTARNMSDYRIILQANQTNKKQINNNKWQEIKKQQIESEEREEKQYLKELIEKYMKEEQKYFDKLEAIQENGNNNFESALSLYRQYDHIYIEEPNQLFLDKGKDLCLNKQVKTQNSSSRLEINLIELQGQQCKSQQILHSPFTSFQKIPSTQFVHVPSNTPQLNKYLKISQTMDFLKMEDQQQSTSLNPSNQVRYSRSYQSEQIKKLFLDIKLNNKIDVVYYLISNPESLQWKDTNGQSLLHIAVLTGRNGLAKDFIRRGLSMESIDNAGRSAKDIAIQFNNQNILEYWRKYCKNKK